MGQTVPRPRWKVWLLTVIGLYPMLLALVVAGGDAAPTWPVFARLAVIAPVAVAWIVWCVNPVQQRILRRWD